MPGKHILACAIVLALGHSISAEYDVNAFCQLVKNDMKLGSIDSCQDYYQCVNGVALNRSCPDTQSFDKNSQMCRASSSVKCYYGVSQPCVGEPRGYVPDVTTCNGWIYCLNFKENGRGECGMNMIFQNGACRYGTCATKSNTVGQAPTLTNVCDIMPNGIYFGSTMGCTIWQLCTSNGLKTGECASAEKLVFDVQRQLCNYETPGMCSRVTYVNIQPEPEMPCTVGQKSTFKASESSCSNYFECDGQIWKRQSCPSGYYYDIYKMTCRTRQSARPSPKCSRCEGTRRQFVNSVDPTCRQYSVCQSGRTSSSSSCPINYYFSESSQACITDGNGLITYTATNGACFVAPLPPPCSFNDNQCLCADGTVTGCKCGIDTSDDTCIVCPDIVGADGKCTTTPVDCPSVCGNLASDSAKCVLTSGCECGLEAGKCSLCPDIVDADGKCATTPVDCSSVCGTLASDSNACVPTSGCQCGLDAGKCSVCPTSLVSGKCQLCDCTCTDANTCKCGFNVNTCVDCAAETCDGCNNGVCTDDSVCGATTGNTCPP